MKKIQLSLFIILLFAAVVYAQEEVIDFESDRWVLKNAEIVQYMDRKCLMGYAVLKDLEFQNGIIEVDIAISDNRKRSYPGIIFRVQSDTDYERFYVRPHRAPLYPDALQYTPVINGIAGWQLYNGEGFTSRTNIPAKAWVHLKMEIHGKQARVYIGKAKKPALVITDLKHGISKGTVGLFGPRDRTAYFSNFKYKVDSNLEFTPPPKIEMPPGIISEWQISQAFKVSQIDREQHPSEQELPEIKWRKVTSEPSGLVDIARYVRRIGREPDCVLAKTGFYSGEDQVKKLLFGYSDEVSIFLNGSLLLRANSSYQLRDPSFLGIVGLNDAVYLPLRKGENELLLMITEAFGGWGFMCQDGTAVFQHESVKKLWMTDSSFKIPESVAYDAERNVLYVSNYDGYNPSTNEGKQSISKVSMDGKIEELKWVTGLFNPTGLKVFKDKLFVVERRNLVEIDIPSEKILKRHPVPKPRFINDIGIDKSGNIYISDSGKHVIYKFFNGKFEEWLKSSAIRNPNGLHVYKNTLIVGNNGDNCLKSVNLETKEIKEIVNLGAGIIDGIGTDKEGNYIVSHWNGKVYRITPEGRVTKLLDTTVPEYNCADLEFITEKNLVVVPTFMKNRVIVFKLSR
ncbi:MAG: SMP-30/gluconolactonase/LRE family protein [Candidatus Aminicenantes bacterium]|nr:MAG: SMP-30/gluconolactonase/LRE family protein [Candidatus Aminicenantes bacterium]